MKLSKYYLPTLKDLSDDVQMPSHKLMLRAGLMRNLSAGIFSWLPAGWNVMKNIMEILRDEMEQIDAIEFHLPALNPKDIWDSTGRVEAFGDNMFHIKNRENLVLAPTHEEIMAYHAKQHVNSYKDLPMVWYQIQSKFRNEPRPRSGVLRGRQFFMKDAYSLDSSFEGLDISYEKQYNAYKSIFDRCGIKYFVVGASSGAMGGSKSQEFMVENEFGEDVCAVSESGDAQNLEVATSVVSKVGRIENEDKIEEFATPNSKSINDLITDFKLDEMRCAKSLIYIVENKPILILMRGNDELVEEKLTAVLGTGKHRPADDKELLEFTGANAGSIGPVNLKTKMRILADNLLQNSNGLYAGANKNGFHYKNIDLKRDVTDIEYFDFRKVNAGEISPFDGKPIRIVNAIELGHIFKLGTKYSDSLGAKILDENGKEKPIVMGSYGIGVERIMACYIEQNHDENGIIWNGELSPFDLHIIALNPKKSTEVRELSEKLYQSLCASYLKPIYDDRDVSVGIKFKDADLLGVPYQIVIGSKGLDKNEIELKNRATGEKQSINISDIEIDDLVEDLILELDL
ncbi:proline--tRNA ligase [Candidatus Kapabacteria bacterium]|nr:proline--tRNA ligase [Candidatus Kapabacteria bacterium]